MNRNFAVPVPALILASAIIWAGVIIACMTIVHGTTYAEGIRATLFLGVITHLLFIWGPLGRAYRKQKQEQEQLQKYEE